MSFFHPFLAEDSDFSFTVPFMDILCPLAEYSGNFPIPQRLTILLALQRNLAPKCLLTPFAP
jgi:hypothetical protein